MGAEGALQPARFLANRLGAELHMLLIEELSRVRATIFEMTGEKQEADQRCAFIVASARRRLKKARGLSFARMSWLDGSSNGW